MGGLALGSLSPPFSTVIPSVSAVFLEPLLGLHSKLNIVIDNSSSIVNMFLSLLGSSFISSHNHQQQQQQPVRPVQPACNNHLLGGAAG